MGGAGADFAKPLGALDRPDLDRGDQLVGTADALAVPGVESGEGNPALFRGTAQDDGGVGRRQHR